MSSRTASWTQIKAGITRLRVAGKASQEALYDLVNAKVTQAGDVESRAGTVLDHDPATETLAGTKGLAAFDRLLWVFSHQSVELFGKYRNLVLVHPEWPETPIREIHFSAPFLGFLYVVVEFESTPDNEPGETDTFHYWAERGVPWEAGTVFQEGQLVEPTTPNGLAYRASRSSDPAPFWEPGAPREVGDRVSPSTFTGYEYVVVAVFGANPRSGEVEPIWPTSNGGQVIEDVDLPPPPPANAPSPPPTAPPPGYGGGGGGGFPPPNLPLRPQ